MHHGTVNIDHLAHVSDVTNCLTTDDVSEIYTLNLKFLILTIKYIIKFTNQCWRLQLHIRYSKRTRNPRASSLTSRNMPFKLVLMSMCMMHRRDPDLIMTTFSRSCTRRRIHEHTWIDGHEALDRNPRPGHDTLYLRLIPGYLYSACPHRQVHTLFGRLNSRAALPNSYPVCQAGRQFVQFLWWSSVCPDRKTNPRPTAWVTDTLTPKPSRRGKWTHKKKQLRYLICYNTLENTHLSKKAIDL